MINIAINKNHDPAELGKTLREKGRLQIRNFFPDDVAESLYELIAQNQTWFVAYNIGNEYFEVPVEDLIKLDPQQRQQFLNPIMTGAQKGFQYFFQQYYMTEAIENGREQGHPLHQMHDYVNSDDFLGFMRTLTGADDINRSDSFASRYLQGNFLTLHDDTHANETRVAAYTISMTKNWNPDWGGNTVFYDDEGNIVEGYKPAFNTLNIFMIPQKHAVQHVAPFAAAPRLSYLGWLKR
ncbi:MAG: 2OG-Fe(II) oxygenase [Alphaproteobacteria bacterium]|nr:2OG-Fe(II) oxygenase [Alphaproteobacteria bacterium]